ncbi:MAG: hypothetical protein HYZ21_07425 [Chloroflexi bacterium]|nr:hypothetical protein [Chloroflexota bacterium]
MTLKFKRNLPLVLLLVSILSFMAVAMGNQRIISYTVNAETLRTMRLSAYGFDLSDDLSQLAGLFGTDANSVGVVATAQP